jgi:cobalamin biosynthesis Mg chelatase CobN
MNFKSLLKNSFLKLFFSIILLFIFNFIFLSNPLTKLVDHSFNKVALEVGDGTTIFSQRFKRNANESSEAPEGGSSSSYTSTTTTTTASTPTTTASTSKIIQDSEATVTPEQEGKNQESGQNSVNNSKSESSGLETKWIVLIIIAIVLLIIGALAFYFFKFNDKKE